MASNRLYYMDGTEIRPVQRLKVAFSEDNVCKVGEEDGHTYDGDPESSVVFDLSRDIISTNGNGQVIVESMCEKTYIAKYIVEVEFSTDGGKEKAQQIASDLDFDLSGNTYGARINDSNLEDVEVED